MVIWTPGQLHVEDFVVDGQTSVYKTPVEEYLKNHPGSVLISYDEFAAKQTEIENREFLTPWKEIDEETWTEKLEILPPEKWQQCGEHREAFRMMEYYTGNITDHFFKIGKRYFSALRRTSQSYAEMTGEIKKQFGF